MHEVDASLVENVQAYILFYVKKELRLNLNLWLLENIIENEIKNEINNLWFQYSIMDSIFLDYIFNVYKRISILK